MTEQLPATEFRLFTFLPIQIAGYPNFYRIKRDESRASYSSKFFYRSQANLPDWQIGRSNLLRSDIMRSET